MSYKEKPQLHLYEYKNNSFSQIAIIDDFQEVSFEHNLYSAGTFTIMINYNIPNALLFERGLFVQFGSDPYDFGEIYSINDRIGEDGKGSQIRTITGYDARYIFKRRIIKNLNSNGMWKMTAKGELCLRNLIADQCGENAETKRQLPIINTIPQESDAIGKEYSVSEQFTNLYEVCKTIATQSEIGWRVKFDDGSLTLECFEGTDRSDTVQFSTDFDSLRDGEFSDSSESYSNAIYIGGKGQNDERDIYEGEDGAPNGLDRFEAWDDQSQMTTTDEYTAEALSMLTQYGQTITVSGNGLAKCPYVYKEQYDVGDIITIAFSGKKAVAQILSVTERWAWNQYDINFSFGKPQNTLSEQLQIMLRKIQGASDKTNSIESVKWYTIPTDNLMPKEDVTCNTLGFTGAIASGGNTFTLYLDNEGTGAKTYNIYVKNLSGNDKLTLTTGKSGATNYQLSSGNYVGQIYVDENGNIFEKSLSATNTISIGNLQPATSSGVAQIITDTKNGTVMENLDLNSYTECGLYVTKNDESYTNVPEGMYRSYFSLMVVATAKYLPPQEDSPFRNQILYKYDTSEIYIRSYSWKGGLTWGEWRKVVFQDELGIKETEKRIGTWIDGSPLYEKAIVLNVPQNGEYSVPINVVNLKNVVNWRGNFFQGDYQNPAYIMHIPYTYFDQNNLANMINIYGFYLPSSSAFNFNFYGSGIYANAYFNGQAILYVQYTKNS
jgi:hypothetical protein